MEDYIVPVYHHDKENALSCDPANLLPFTRDIKEGFSIEGGKFNEPYRS